MNRVISFVLRPLLIVALTLLLSACVSGQKKVVQQIDNSGREQIFAELGVEIVALRQTAAGHMLDLRYRVLDREKAMDLFREDLKPVVIHERTGKSLTVPIGKIGPMRQTSRNPEVGRVYFIFFGNPIGFVKPGDRVTLVIGSHRIEHLMIE